MTLTEACLLYLLYAALLASYEMVEDEARGFWGRILYSFAFTAFGPAVHLGASIGGIATRIYVILQLNTWWALACNRKKLKKTTQQLVDLNRHVTKFHNSKSFPDRMWRLALRALNSHNNY